MSGWMFKFGGGGGEGWVEVFWGGWGRGGRAEESPYRGEGHQSAAAAPLVSDGSHAAAWRPPTLVITSECGAAMSSFVGPQ